MTREKRTKKNKYRTVSLPRRLADDIQEIIDEFGYWPSLEAFVREACLTKFKEEKRTLRELREETPS